MLEEWLIEEGTRITRAWVPSARLVHIHTRSRNLGDRQRKREAQNPGLPPTPIYVLISPLRLPPGGCCEDCRAPCGIRQNYKLLCNSDFNSGASSLRAMATTGWNCSFSTHLWFCPQRGQKLEFENESAPGLWCLGKDPTSHMNGHIKSLALVRVASRPGFLCC